MKRTITRRSFLAASAILGANMTLRSKASSATPDPLATRKKFSVDPLRPAFHFLPPSGWMNDPNGVIEVNGQYHLFYQHNPLEAAWGQIHWGHAVSDDLVRWRDQPIALAPTAKGPDRNGCWSGSSVVNNGVPTILYTGAEYTVPTTQYRGGVDARQTVCLATGSPDLKAWTKYPKNPVKLKLPAETDPEGVRDPYVWREGDHWRMVLAGGLLRQGAAVFMYRSSDLLAWDYIGPLLVDTSVQGVFETPSFFKLEDKHVLTVGSKYFIGRYENDKFTPEASGVLDHSYAYYAPQIMTDSQGRRIVFAWSWEWGWYWQARNDAKLKAPGWAGVTPLPRTLELGKNNTLLIKPVEELNSLRGTPTQLEAVTMGDEIALDFRNNSFELMTEFEPNAKTDCGLKLIGSDGKLTATISYDKQRNELTVQPVPQTRDGGIIAGYDSTVRVALKLEPKESLKLRVFFDRSILEVFANDRLCITVRVYPKAKNQLVRVFGKDTRLRSLTAWPMESIW
jgi:beta-fructofuranosidase